MTEQELKNRLDKAFREDRDRFFAVADTLYFQPKYAKHKEEIEVLKQEWRDAPQGNNYPYMEHPKSLPEWFPKVRFASQWNERTLRKMYRDIFPTSDKDELSDKK